MENNRELKEAVLATLRPVVEVRRVPGAVEIRLSVYLANGVGVCASQEVTDAEAATIEPAVLTDILLSGLAGKLTGALVATLKQDLDRMLGGLRDAAGGGK